MITSIFIALFYIATIIFVIGMARKIYTFATTPLPLKIPVAPTAFTKSGVIVRVLQEVFLFRSLFYSNKWIWIFGYLFHIGLLLITLRHLRYFWPGDVPDLLLLTQPFKYAAFMMLIGLLGLLGRRVFVDRVRYISAPSDYLMLIMLIIIVITGIIMTFTSNHIDIIMVKSFATGLLAFNWSDMPSEIQFIVHFLLAMVLLLIAPISKLLHIPGIFFSPTITQVDDARKKRNIANWALKQELDNEIVLEQTLGADEDINKTKKK